jgi:hypothetical protein
VSNVRDATPNSTAAVVTYNNKNHSHCRRASLAASQAFNARVRDTAGALANP